jgi:hypothetical protein
MYRCFHNFQNCAAISVRQQPKLCNAPAPVAALPALLATPPAPVSAVPAQVTVHPTPMSAHPARLESVPAPVDVSIAPGRLGDRSKRSKQFIGPSQRRKPMTRHIRFPRRGSSNLEKKPFTWSRNCR